jgi:uncharacterized protein YdhG (YjbR/CyaY superfamily)
VPKGKLDGAKGRQSVDEYIASCPARMRGELRKVRGAIRAVAPGAVETTSYFDLPGFSYPGYDYNGMFAWFGLRKSSIILSVRPPTVEDHRRELANYSTTKAIVRFPSDRPVPLPLVQQLVRASLEIMRRKPPRSGPKRRPA